MSIFRKPILQHVAIFFIAAAVASYVLWHLHISRPRSQQARFYTKPSSDAAIELERIKGLKIRSKGRTLWELTIDGVRINKQRTMAQINGLAEAVYYASGKPLLMVSAKHAIWNMLTNEIKVWGDVAVRTESGLQMMMERVIWRDRDCLLEIPCKVIGESERLRFITMRVIYMPIKMHLSLCDGVFARTSDVQFQCSRLDVDLKGNEYVAYPPVRLVVHLSQPLERFEIKPITAEALIKLIGINTTTPAQPSRKDGKEKSERRMIFDSPTQPLKRVGRNIFGADVIVREEGEDYVIRVKRFSYDEEKEYLLADGVVHYEDSDLVLTSPKAELFRRERKVLLHSKVRLESKVKEVSKSSSQSEAGSNNKQGDEKAPIRERIKRKPTVIDCERLEYFYRERKAVATGNLQFKHGQYAGSAEMVIYWHRDDKLVAEGKVIVRDTEEGHIFECTSVTILLANGERKEDEIIVAPGAKALLRVKEEEEEKPKEQPGKEQKQPEESKQTQGKGKLKGENNQWSEV